MRGEENSSRRSGRPPTRERLPTPRRASCPPRRGARSPTPGPRRRSGPNTPRRAGCEDGGSRDAAPGAGAPSPAPPRKRPVAPDRAWSPLSDLAGKAPSRRMFSPDTAASPRRSREIRQYLEKTYGEKDLYRRGLRVDSTLDPELQAFSEEALGWGLRRLARRHGFHH